jgi:peptide/nickel transport system substrate-binding protein
MQASSGPFYLDSYNPAGRVITIKAFRDASYPFEQGHWSIYEKPKIASISKVDAPKTVLAGQSPLNVDVEVSVDGKATQNATVYYFISNRDGRTVISGNTTSSDRNATYSINIPKNQTAALSTGPSLLKVFAVSNTAYRPDIHSTTLIAVNPLTRAQQ